MVRLNQVAMDMGGERRARSTDPGADPRCRSAVWRSGQSHDRKTELFKDTDTAWSDNRSIGVIVKSETDTLAPPAPEARIAIEDVPVKCLVGCTILARPYH